MMMMMMMKKINRMNQMDDDEEDKDVISINLPKLGWWSPKVLRIP